MDRRRFQPDALQDRLFEIEPVPERDEPVDIEALVKDPNVSNMELAEHVARVRRKAILVREAAASAVQEETTGPKPERRRGVFRGGAFISGLKRWTGSADHETLEKTDDLPAITNLLGSQKNIMQQLQPEPRKQVFRGLLFSAKEYKRLTWSPALISDRIDAHVQAKSEDDGRSPTAAYERSYELRMNAARHRYELVGENISKVGEDLLAANKLGAEMELPRQAHMTEAAMNKLMTEMSERYHGMIRAISQNHQLDTKRTAALHAGLDYLLSQADTQKAGYYWRDINKTFIWWTEQKLPRLGDVSTNLMQEVKKIHDERNVRSA